MCQLYMAGRKSAKAAPPPEKSPGIAAYFKPRISASAKQPFRAPFARTTSGSDSGDSRAPQCSGRVPSARSHYCNDAWVHRSDSFRY